LRDKDLYANLNSNLPCSNLS